MFMRPFFFLDADTGNGGGGEPQPPAGTPPAPPSGGDTAGAPAGADTGVGGDRITMTPAQLAERLDRAKTSERQGLAKSLGFETLEAMQDAIKAGKAALDAQKSEAERQAEALKQAADRIAQLEGQAATTAQERDQVLIRAAAVERMAGKFIDPGAAFRLLELSKVKLDGGEVAGLDDAITALEKKYPWTLADTRQKVSSTISPTNPDGSAAAPKENDADRRSRYFAGGGDGGFFAGGGLKAEVAKRPK